ncbi:MAG: DUF4907 domain-containing protein [Bacteroidales bacterium]|nr:DUF4907 domain-containing protein [Bacteroidales bacterium]
MKSKWMMLLVFMFSLNAYSYVLQSEKKPEAVVYVNSDANYGFRIKVDGKTILEQEAIEPASDNPAIYFTKADAEKAAAYILRQMEDGNSPVLIDQQTWKEIQLKSSHE